MYISNNNTVNTVTNYKCQKCFDKLKSQEYGMFGCIVFQKQILLVFVIFQKQIRFYPTFSNFVSRSQTSQTFFSTLFCLEIWTVNYS
jgi:hypothetical protein